MAELKLTPMSDVAKPGTTPPDASARPLVVGHTTDVTDPMVNPEKSASTGSMKSKLTPDSSAAEIDKDAADTSDKEMAEKKVEKTEKEIIDEKQVRLAEIIESGEYIVSFGQEKSGKDAATFASTVIAIVLLGVVLLFVLTDLKIIDLGIKLPFHIFKQ